MSTVKSVVRFAIALLIAFGIARAQSQFGSIAGHVVDPSGALVPGATVRATNEATNVGFSTTTSSSGSYEINGLNPGNYTVTANTAGFKEFRLTGVVVIAAQVTGTDLHLEVGGAHEQITVSASTAQLNTESGSVAASTPTQILEMPATLPQATQSLAETLIPYLQGQQYIGGRQVAAYGSRSYDRRIDVDGAVYGISNTYPLREPRGTLDELQVTSLDADAEHQTSNTDEMTTAKGTNNLHGFIWTEIQNQALNAFSWYTPPGTPRPPGTATVGYGFSVGGPVYLPKLYNGRSKTFFHVTFEKYHDNEPGTSTDSVPSPLMLGGSFSQLMTPIINPSTGVAYPGNIITTPESPIGKAILSLYPPANVTSLFTSNNATTPGEYMQPFHTIFLRVDQQLGSKDNIHGTYGYNDQLITESNSGITSAGLDYVLYRSNYVAASENHIFSPSVLNEVTFGAKLGNFQSITNTANGVTLTTNLGLPQPLVAPPAAGVTGGPIINVTGIGGFNPEPLGAGTTDPHTYTFRDTVSWIRGRFTTKAGFELIDYATTSASFSNLFGTYNFTGLFTGSPIADLYLGLPSSTTRTEYPGPIGQAQKQLGYFANVDGRITKNLTFNLGLRIEHETPAVNPTGAYYNFNIANGDLVVPSQSSMSLLNPGLTPALLADIETASAAGFPSNLVNARTILNPRVGFAYHAFKDTVVRGGFGMYSGIQNYGAPTGGPFTAGIQNFTNVNTCVNGACTPSFTMANPFPGTGVAAVSGLSVSGVNPRPRVPEMYQWNFTIEQRLPANFVLRTTYTGNETDQLGYRRNVDLPMASTIPISTSRLPYPQWFSVTYGDSGANSSYESLDVTFSRRWSNGLTAYGGYDLAKCLTDSDEGGVAYDGAFNSLAATVEDPYNRNRDKGNCQSLARHRFRTMYTLALPVGKGRALLNNPQGLGGGVLDKIVGGWTWSGLFVASTGHYYSPYWTGFDAANTGQTLIRPDRTCSGAANLQTWDFMFNPACFVQPPSGRYGDAGVGILNGLGYWRYDMGLYKDFSFSKDERMPKFRVTAQALNLFNRAEKDCGEQTPFIINSPSTVARADDIAYDSGLTGNEGDLRRIFFELRILW